MAKYLVAKNKTVKRNTGVLTIKNILFPIPVYVFVPQT